MQHVRILGTSAAAPTGTGTASTVEGSHFVMIANTTTAVHEVTIQTAVSGTTIGSIALLGSERMVIKKDDTDVIFAANAGVYLTPVYPN